MHTGKELGQALREAMELKGVKQHEVATAFKVSQPSVSEWLKYGRISKRHLTKLVEYFTDVVGPQHWGLPPTWGASQSQDAIRLSPEERDLVLAFRDLPAKKAKELLSQLMLEAEEFRQYGASVLARFGARGVVSNERAAETLPPPPAAVVKPFISSPPTARKQVTPPPRKTIVERAIELTRDRPPARKVAAKQGKPHASNQNHRVQKPRGAKPAKGRHRES